MSTRSYPAGFQRPERLIPPETIARHESMMRSLQRRCAEVEARKVSGTPSASGDQTVSAPHEKTPSAGGESQSGLRSIPALPQLSRPAPLKWLQPQGDGVRTDNGKYAVCRVSVAGNRTYELRCWQEDGTWKLLERQGRSFKEVRTMAQQHADGVL